jgi:eukaryotic-like serine/threonine-protein kinase
MDRMTAALAGRYRIERELGAGGMATVYLAADLKHDRKVALKVLKPELAAVLGAERFVVEIKTTAALQHPHILPLFDSGTTDGFLFYVMPFIEGETIREKLNRETQFGVDEAVRITTEVADALDYAHRHGVIHRDIKPENILLHDGRAMVMDFGIALAVSAAAGGRMTETGLSLGTPHYMSPEQATADKQITARSDIYSLASVLYEMLAGVPPHEGGSAQQTIMRIITETPKPVQELRRSVPPNVAAAVAKALEKLPADRFDSASAFAAALTDPSFALAGARTTDGGSVSAARPWKVLSLALAVCAAALLWTTLRGMRSDAPFMPVTRASIDIGDIRLGVSGDFLVSPDGSRFAITGTLGGPIYWRPADEGEFRAIPGTENAEYAAFSPDGKEIAFGLNTGVTLKRVALSGGAPQLVTTMGQDIGGIDWGTDSSIVYTASGGSGLFRVAARGGVPESILGLDVTVRNPRLLPGGHQVLFTGQTDSSVSTQIVDLASHAVRLVRARALDATYVQPGYLVYADPAGTLWAARFDLTKGAIVGEPVTVLDGVDVFGLYTHFAVSQTGTLVFGTGNMTSSNARRLQFVSLGGGIQDIPLTPRIMDDIRLAPDGRSLAYDGSAGGRGPFIFTYDVVLAETPRQQTTDGQAFAPVWSPSGTRFAFSHHTRASTQLKVRDAAGNGSDRVILADTSIYVAAWDWPSEDTLVVTRVDTTALWILDLSSDTVTASRYVAAEGGLDEARVSPAHHLIAYRAAGAIWVRSFPVAGPATRISSGPGRDPAWAPDGRTLYYWVPPGGAVRNEWTLVAARLRREPSLAVARLDTVFRSATFRSWALLPDGKRFILANAPTDSGGAAGASRERFVLVTNLLEILERRTR